MVEPPDQETKVVDLDEYRTTGETTPPRRRQGRPTRTSRQILDSILWVLTGGPWFVDVGEEDEDHDTD